MNRKLYTYLLNVLGRMQESEGLRRVYKEQQRGSIMVLSGIHGVTEWLKGPLKVCLVLLKQGVHCPPRVRCSG